MAKATISATIQFAKPASRLAISQTRTAIAFAMSAVIRAPPNTRLCIWLRGVVITREHPGRNWRRNARRDRLQRSRRDDAPPRAHSAPARRRRRLFVFPGHRALAAGREGGAALCAARTRWSVDRAQPHARARP